MKLLNSDTWFGSFLIAIIMFFVGLTVLAVAMIFSAICIYLIIKGYFIVLAIFVTVFFVGLFTLIIKYT